MDKNKAAWIILGVFILSATVARGAVTITEDNVTSNDGNATFMYYCNATDCVNLTQIMSPTGNSSAEIQAVIESNPTGNSSAEIQAVVDSNPTGNSTDEIKDAVNLSNDLVFNELKSHDWTNVTCTDIPGLSADLCDGSDATGGSGGVNYWQVYGDWMSPNTTAGGKEKVNLTELNVSGNSELTWVNVSDDLYIGDAAGDQILMQNGDNNNPGIGFISGTDTGMYGSGGTLRWTISGTQAMYLGGTGLTVIPAGTKNAPSFALAADDVGLFRPATDQLAMSAGAIEFIRIIEDTEDIIVINEDSDDIDLRFETDTIADFWEINSSLNEFSIGGGYGSTGLTIHSDGNISTDGNVTADYFVGNGSLLTGLLSTGTLTDTKICTWDDGNSEIDCDYTDLQGGGGTGANYWMTDATTDFMWPNTTAGGKKKINITNLNVSGNIVLGGDLSLGWLNLTGIPAIGNTTAEIQTAINNSHILLEYLYVHESNISTYNSTYDAKVTGNTTAEIQVVIESNPTGNSSAEIQAVVESNPTGNSTAEIQTAINSSNINLHDLVLIQGFSQKLGFLNLTDVPALGNTTAEIQAIVDSNPTGNSSAEIQAVIESNPTGNSTTEIQTAINASTSLEFPLLNVTVNMTAGDDNSWWYYNGSCTIITGPTSQLELC